MNLIFIHDYPAPHWARMRWLKVIDPIRAHVTSVSHVYATQKPIQKATYEIIKRKRKKVPPNTIQLDSGHCLPLFYQSQLTAIQHNLHTNNSPADTILIFCGEMVHLYFTGAYSLKAWRGSVRKIEGYSTLTMLAPEAYAKKASWKDLHRADVRRLYNLATLKIPTEVSPPKYRAHRTAQAMLEALRRIPARSKITVDVETYCSQIFMIGICWGEEGNPEADVLTLRDANDNFLTFEEEVAVVAQLRIVLASAEVIYGQNFGYDWSYLSRRMGWWPLPGQVRDTMIMAHLMSPMQEKSLDILASLHLAEYCYWKKDAQNWWETNNIDGEEEYNARDIIATHKLGHIFKRQIEGQGLAEQCAFQHDVQASVKRWNEDGLFVDEARARKLRKVIEEKLTTAQQEVKAMTGLHPAQSIRLTRFVYDDLRLVEQINRKTGRRTLDDEAVEILARAYPHLNILWGPLLQARSYKIFLDNLDMQRNPRGRLATKYNVAGTSTFRFSSTHTDFNEGGNLQNLTAGDEKQGIPNMRGIVSADPGWVGFEADLKQADAQVVAWDADDEILKDIFRRGEDLHNANARMIYEIPASVSESEVKNMPERKHAKAGVHATNYGATANTLAVTLGCTKGAAALFISRWFALHPQIRLWQRRKIRELETTGKISNIFGFACKWVDEIDFRAHNEALAWTPQSTVAIYINKIALAWEQVFKRDILRVQLQTHDSLRFQIREDRVQTVLPQLISIAKKQQIPYDDPLVIPLEVFQVQYWGEEKGAVALEY